MLEPSPFDPSGYDVPAVVFNNGASLWFFIGGADPTHQPVFTGEAACSVSIGGLNLLDEPDGPPTAGLDGSTVGSIDYSTCSSSSARPPYPSFTAASLFTASLVIRTFTQVPLLVDQ